MKKLLAIILTVVCIIPTMAVSFSVSAKAASNQVKTTNVSLYQYGESTYTVNKSKSMSSATNTFFLFILFVMVLLNTLI